MVDFIKGYTDYNQFVKSMEAEGWHREQLSIDENTTQLVATYSVAAAASTRAIEVTCPAGRIITTMGTQQVMAGADRATAHALILRLAGTAEVEMNKRLKVKIEKIKPSEETTLLARDFYSMFSLTKQIVAAGDLDKSDNEIYRWRRGIVLYGNEIMRISPVSTNLALDSSYIRMQMDIDLWTRIM